MKVSVWGSDHTNYTLNNATFDPLDIENNYWTNGPADSNSKSVLIATTTTSPAPARSRQH